MLATHRHLLAALVLFSAATQAQLSVWNPINLTFSENETTNVSDWTVTALSQDNLAGVEYWATTVSNASATATFDSSAFTIRGWIHPGGPLLNVTLDGRSVGLVNTSSDSEPEYVGMLFESGQLNPNITHTLRLEYASPLPTASGGPGALGISELLVMSQDEQLSAPSEAASGSPSASTTPLGHETQYPGPVTSSPVPSLGTALPIAWIVQGAAGAVVILPMLFVISLSFWKHRRRNRVTLELWERDRDKLAAEPLFSHAQPLTRPASTCESRRSSAGSIVSDLPSMESMKTSALLSLPSTFSVRSTSPAHSLGSLDTRT